jgi:hypothetical protein
VPIAGIAFLWFIGVVRDRMRQLEDKSFSNVFFGSGLLYLGLTFVAAWLAADLLASYALEADKLIASSGICAAEAQQISYPAWSGRSVSLWQWQGGQTLPWTARRIGARWQVHKLTQK